MAAKLAQGCLQILDDLAGDYVGRQQAVGVFKAGVTDESDVEVDLVPGDQLVVAERPEPFSGLAFLPWTPSPWPR